MDTRWLETFMVAAREGSFSNAAAMLGYARSTVTHHLQALEREVGGQLFDRSLVGQPLTPSGLAMLEHAEVILTHIGLAQARLEKIAEDRSRPVRLVSTESTAAYRLATLMRTIQRRLPAVKIEVDIASSVAAIRDLLNRGQCDMALLTVAPFEDCGEKVGRLQLWDENPVMVGLPGAVEPPRKVLATQRGCVYRDILESEWLPRTAPAAEIVQMGSVEAVKSGVLSGLGAGLLPEVAAGPWVKGGQLVELRWQPTGPAVTEVRWHRELSPAPIVELLNSLPPSTSRVPSSA